MKMSGNEGESNEIVVTARRLTNDNSASSGGGGGGGGFLSGFGFGGHDWSGVLALGPSGISSANTSFLLDWLTIQILEVNGLPLPDTALPEPKPDPIIIFPTPVLPSLPVPAPEWTALENDIFDFAVEQGWFYSSDWNYA
jgi:hypothetical protein